MPAVLPCFPSPERVLCCPAFLQVLQRRWLGSWQQLWVAPWSSAASLPSQLSLTWRSKGRSSPLARASIGGAAGSAVCARHAAAEMGAMQWRAEEGNMDGKTKLGEKGCMGHPSGVTCLEAPPRTLAGDG